MAVQPRVGKLARMRRASVNAIFGESDEGDKARAAEEEEEQRRLLAAEQAEESEGLQAGDEGAKGQGEQAGPSSESDSLNSEYTVPRTEYAAPHLESEALSRSRPGKMSWTNLTAPMSGANGKEFSTCDRASSLNNHQPSPAHTRASRDCIHFRPPTHPTHTLPPTHTTHPRPPIHPPAHQILTSSLLYIAAEPPPSKKRRNEALRRPASSRWS